MVLGQRLLVGVHCNKFYALQTVADHAVDCVAAAAAHTNDLDRRNIFIHFFIEHECHNFVLHRICYRKPALFAQEEFDTILI